MEKTTIDFPKEYWAKRKQFLKAIRQWYLFGKVRMIKRKCKNRVWCSVEFYHNRHTYYLINGAINFGAWLKSKGYRTLYNSFEYKK